MPELTEKQIEIAAEAGWQEARKNPFFQGVEEYWNRLQEIDRRSWSLLVKAVAPHVQYAPTEPGAPLSDKECNELNVSIYGGVSAEAIAVINHILAKRNTVQPSNTETPSAHPDGCHCSGCWAASMCDGDPLASVAQADWDDQHGHRTEILPLIGGESVKKEKAVPVDGDLAKKAHSAFMSAPDKPWNAVARMIQQDRDARWMKAIATEAEEHGVLTGVVGEFIAGVHERIEAKPVKKEQPKPIDVELLGKALNIYRANLGFKNNGERMAAVIRLVADYILRPVTNEEWVSLTGRKFESERDYWVTQLLLIRRSSIEAKQQTLEERIHAVLMGSDSVTDKFNEVMALIAELAKERQ